MNKIICFDFDGVIVDGFDPIVEIGIEASRLFPSGRVLEADDVRTIQNLTWFEAGKLIGLNETEAREYSNEVFRKFETVDLTKIIFNHAMLPVLEKLAAKHSLFVITASTKKYVATVLKNNNCLKYFTEIFDGTDKKSKSDKLIILKEKYKSHEIFMIGDSQSDVIQGNLAGAETIAVTWGWQSAELLKKHDPAHIANAPEDLLNILA